MVAATTRRRRPVPSIFPQGSFEETASGSPRATFPKTAGASRLATISCRPSHTAAQQAGWLRKARSLGDGSNREREASTPACGRRRHRIVSDAWHAPGPGMAIWPARPPRRINSYHCRGYSTISIPTKWLSITSAARYPIREVTYIWVEGRTAGGGRPGRTGYRRDAHDRKQLHRSVPEPRSTTMRLQAGTWRSIQAHPGRIMRDGPGADESPLHPSAPGPCHPPAPGRLDACSTGTFPSRVPTGNRARAANRTHLSRCIKVA